MGFTPASLQLRGALPHAPHGHARKPFLWEQVLGHSHTGHAAFWHILGHTVADVVLVGLRQKLTCSSDSSEKRTKNYERASCCYQQKAGPPAGPAQPAVSPGPLPRLRPPRWGGSPQSFPPFLLPLQRTPCPSDLPVTQAWTPGCCPSLLACPESARLIAGSLLQAPRRD